MFDSLIENNENLSYGKIMSVGALVRGKGYILSAIALGSMLGPYCLISDSSMILSM